MPGKQAKILSISDVDDLLLFASCSRNFRRNRVIVLLSAKAGLRAAEIAKLTWDMVLNASGQIGRVIELHNNAAKNGGGRLIPLHPSLRAALTDIARPPSTNFVAIARRQTRSNTEAKQTKSFVTVTTQIVLPWPLRSAGAAGMGVRPRPLDLCHRHVRGPRARPDS
jgi:integrase